MRTRAAAHRDTLCINEVADWWTDVVVASATGAIKASDVPSRYSHQDKMYRSPSRRSKAVQLPSHDPDCDAESLSIMSQDRVRRRPYTFRAV